MTLKVIISLIALAISAVNTDDIREQDKLFGLENSNFIDYDIKPTDILEHNRDKSRRLFAKYSPPSDVKFTEAYLGEDVGKPLFLTPLLKDGKIKVREKILSSLYFLSYLLSNTTKLFLL